MTAVLPLPPAADPALAVPRPDVEFLVWQTVSPMGGVVSFAFASSDGQPPGWLFTVEVQVDCRASSRKEASDRADMARRAVCALPWAGWPDGVINAVVVTDGPLWMPDPDGAPRYVVRFAITGHPNRSAAELRGTPQ